MDWLTFAASTLEGVDSFSEAAECASMLRAIAQVMTSERDLNVRNKGRMWNSMAVVDGNRRRRGAETHHWQYSAIATKNKTQTASREVAAINGPRRPAGFAGAGVDFIDTLRSLGCRPCNELCMCSSE
jgi:hypothetical protein